MSDADSANTEQAISKMLSAYNESASHFTSTNWEMNRIEWIYKTVKIH